MDDTKLLQHKGKIEEAISTRLCCLFERGRIDSNDRVNGFPVAVIDNWCVLQNMDDFMIDGFSMIRLQDITKMRVDSEDELFNRIFVEEGLTDSVNYELPFHGAQSLTDVFTYFIKSGENIIVECEKREEFYIGMVKKAAKSCIRFHYFDANGKWKDTLDKIDVSSITIIKFRGRYETVFAKYLPPEIDAK